MYTLADDASRTQVATETADDRRECGLLAADNTNKPDEQADVTTLEPSADQVDPLATDLTELERVDGEDVEATAVAGNDLAIRPLPDAEVPALRKTIADHFTILKHRLGRWWRHEVTLARSLTLFATLWAIVLPILRLGLKETSVTLAILVGARIYKAWKDSSDAEAQRPVREEYLQRKLVFGRLIEELHLISDMTPREVHRVRREALFLVASYVRGHLRDRKKDQVYANLLVEDGPEIVVLARDRRRGDGARYPRTTMMAARVFETLEPAVCHDLYREYPHTAPGKRYKSILALPVFLPGEADKVVAVVSIDSTEAWHFADVADELNKTLFPYIALLARTFETAYIPTTKAKKAKAAPMNMTTTRLMRMVAQRKVRSREAAEALARPKPKPTRIPRWLYVVVTILLAALLPGAVKNNQYST